MTIEHESTLHRKSLSEIFDDTDLSCRHCGVIAQPRVAPGKGPHHTAIASEQIGARLWAKEVGRG